MKNNAIDIFDQVAEIYASKYMDVTKYATFFDVFLSHCNSDTKILDIACGPGNIAKYILDVSPKIQYKGIDLSSKMIIQAQKVLPTIDFQVENCIDIEQKDYSFTAVILSFFIPYITNSELLQLIEKIKHTNIIYISTLINDNFNSIEKQKTPDSPVLKTYYHKFDFINELLNETFELIISKQFESNFPEEKELIMVWKRKSND